MELYRKVHQIQSLYNRRNLFQYLFLARNVCLLDSGVAETPQKAILPYLDELKVKPEQMTIFITTHPDFDHQGGNAFLKEVAPRALLGCGEADRAMVEDPRTLYDLRYNFLRNEHGVGFEADPPRDAGKRCPVDIGFSGGETISLDEGWQIEVLHVPGHSHGHLALYDRQNRAAFVSDAVHGRGCPNADGSMGIPVTYFYVDKYLSTLRYLETLEIESLYSGHWPVMHGEEVRDFIADSRRTVELIDRVIIASLHRTAGGVTLRELIEEVSCAMGDWPKDTQNLAMFPVKGHMERLETQGKARIINRVSLTKWTVN